MKYGVPVVLLTLLTLGAVPVPPQQVTWTQNIDPPTAQIEYRYKLTITEEGNATPRVVSLLNVLCGGTALPSMCSAALPLEAQSAIITGNSSTLTATDTRTNQSGPPSTVFKGDQGCIFRDQLYKVSENASAETRKQEMNALLAEFKKAKFKHVSTKQLAGNRFLVTEQCVGYLVP